MRQDFEFNLFLYAFDPRNNFFGLFVKELPEALIQNDSSKTALLLHNLLSAIAPEQHEPNEKHYLAVMQAAFIAAGLEVLGQTPSSSDGKSDMSVFLKDIRFVMEVKYCKADKKDADDKEKADKDLESALDAATDQIRSKDYAAPFRVAGKTTAGVAIAVRGRNEVAVRFFEP
ncbi:MAG: PD-(D/E)XK nuclease domain-containing protein [Deltaproteobacteria bacterium]|nr:PD-(D/E)XK nuclease domain-containing protein [Deltaproteobacteria bacterium]